MAKIFITGSADGLGSLTAQALLAQGHHVVLHARNKERARQALVKAPQAEKVLIADLADITATKKLAEEVNALGDFDVVVHNAGVYQATNEQIFAVNSLAPYILTSLMHKPGRLIYISSGMHLSGSIDLDNIAHNTGYADSKLQVLLLTRAVARLWPAVYTNAVDPGWVPTKMGGSGASDDLQKGFATQMWLAVGEDAKSTGCYYFHQQEHSYSPKADDIALQDAYITRLQAISGIAFPIRHLPATNPPKS